MYRQKKKLKPQELPNLKPLFKQILSDRESVSFLPEKFETDSEVLKGIKGYYNHLQKFDLFGSQINILDKLQKLFSSLDSLDKGTFDNNTIYVAGGQQLKQLSARLLGDKYVINNALEKYYEEVLEPIKGKKPTQAYARKKEKWLKAKYYSVAIITAALPNNNVKWGNVLGGLPERIKKRWDNVKNINGKIKKKEKAEIKGFLDLLLDLLRFVKPFYFKYYEDAKNEAFYSCFEPLYHELAQIVPLYNKVRNHLTRKPYSTKKFKLNFNSSTLLNGWDENKEKDNKGVLLEKDGCYYLAIMNKEDNKIFSDLGEIKPSEEVVCYNKVRYKLLPGPNKMLPKVFFSKKGIESFAPRKNILELYTEGEYKSGESFDLNKCHELIDYFKKAIKEHPDWKHFNFEFSDTNTYKDINGFYSEIAQQGYKLDFKKVAVADIDRLVREGKLYLFKIYSKDFSPHSKGRPNLHTLYWRAVFDEENLADVVYKLNGKAEVFYRKKSLQYRKEVWENGHHHNQLKGKFKYPIIKDRRYAVDKFMFHVPITINFKASGPNNINSQVASFLQGNKDVNIIGIDRGERHLLYLTLIDRQGKIKKQYSLNEIVSRYEKKEFRTDYHKLLSAKEKQRDKARKSWDTIESIKELKEGYLAQVVHTITRMMVEHNAIVVLEDLNFGFKRGRYKVERQVYQKFERRLIEKLNFLVFKEENIEKPAGVLNGLQLANKFEGFEKIGKQSGFLFYVPASYTSKIDPLTGFVNFLRPQYKSVEKSKDFFKCFDSIKYNSAKDWFEFSFFYTKFPGKAVGVKTRWTVCTTNYPRYHWNRRLNSGKGGQEHIMVTPRLKALFEDHSISYTTGQDLKDVIKQQKSPEFFKKLMFLLGVTLQLRYNNGLKGEKEQDYILSPVADAHGRFFNSLCAFKDPLPIDADANGAYHVALKGLLLLKKLDKAKDLSKFKITVSLQEWLTFVQGKCATVIPGK